MRIEDLLRLHLDNDEYEKAVEDGSLDKVLHETGPARRRSYVPPPPPASAGEGEGEGKEEFYTGKKHQHHPRKNMLRYEPDHPHFRDRRDVLVDRIFRY
mmetsp:Transcript_25332/g.42229  ORF Transcript_25332/g.42229 Transcript_25332/m.42229 type:complete len:99 (+) Transcript_25332:693-989(+)